MSKSKKRTVLGSYSTDTDGINHDPEITAQEYKELLEVAKEQGLRVQVFLGLDESTKKDHPVPKDGKLKVFKKKFADGNEKLFVVLGNKKRGERVEQHSLARFKELGIKTCLKTWSILNPQREKLSEIAKVKPKSDTAIVLNWFDKAIEKKIALEEAYQREHEDHINDEALIKGCSHKK